MERISRRLMNWASILEDTTLTQAEMTAAMPFIHPHLALMPDAADLVEIRYTLRQIVNVKGDWKCSTAALIRSANSVSRRRRRPDRG